MVFDARVLLRTHVLAALPLWGQIAHLAEYPPQGWQTLLKKWGLPGAVLVAPMLELTPARRHADFSGKPS